MNFPSELRYTKEHEWVRVEGDVATIGITDHAQDSLGDIVYLGDLPSEGDEVEQEDVIGVIESVKATSDIYSPVSGRIVEVNSDLTESPEVINEDPYGEGWIVRIEVSNPEELESLMSAEDYKRFLEESK